MDNRQALIETLKTRMRETRRLLDPALLARAQRATGTTPDDRASALKAVEIFLRAHPAQDAVRARLRALFGQKD